MDIHFSTDSPSKFVHIPTIPECNICQVPSANCSYFPATATQRLIAGSETRLGSRGRRRDGNAEPNFVNDSQGRRRAGLEYLPLEGEYDSVRLPYEYDTDIGLSETEFRLANDLFEETTGMRMCDIRKYAGEVSYDELGHVDEHYMTFNTRYDAAFLDDVFAKVTHSGPHESIFKLPNEVLYMIFEELGEEKDTVLFNLKLTCRRFFYRISGCHLLVFRGCRDEVVGDHCRDVVAQMYRVCLNTEEIHQNRDLPPLRTFAGFDTVVKYALNSNLRPLWQNAMLHVAKDVAGYYGALDQVLAEQRAASSSHVSGNHKWDNTPVSFWANNSYSCTVCDAMENAVWLLERSMGSLALDSRPAADVGHSGDWKLPVTRRLTGLPIQHMEVSGHHCVYRWNPRDLEQSRALNRIIQLACNVLDPPVKPQLVSMSYLRSLGAIEGQADNMGPVWYCRLCQIGFGFDHMFFHFMNSHHEDGFERLLCSVKSFRNNKLVRLHSPLVIQTANGETAEQWLCKWLDRLQESGRSQKERTKVYCAHCVRNLDHWMCCKELTFAGLYDHIRSRHIVLCDCSLCFAARHDTPEQRRINNTEEREQEGFVLRTNDFILISSPVK